MEGRYPAAASAWQAVVLLVLAFAFQVGSHASLISLPYFWDEAGYYVPAAQDFFTGTSLVPTKLTNAHPPLLSIYLSLCWYVFGQSIECTRLAMLAVSAVGLWAVFRIGRTLSSPATAALATMCTAVYPVFFAQSSLALSDLPGAAFSLLGLSYYFENRKRGAAFFSIAVLWKETAILVPLALLLVDSLPRVVRLPSGMCNEGPRLKDHLFWTLPPLVILTIWYLYHWMETGFVFGNAEFLRYNLAANFNLSRFVLALAGRCWQAFGHMGMLPLTLAAAWVLFHRISAGKQIGPPFAPRILLRLGAVVVTHLIVLSVFGGALLARYLLPIVPLIILSALEVVKRRVPLAALAVVCFLASLHIDPPYHFAVEENLVYRDFVGVHRDAAAFLESDHRGARIVTSWPASSELTLPLLGYVKAPLTLLHVERLESSEIRRLERNGHRFDLVVIFNREYAPGDRWLPVGRFISRTRLWPNIRYWFGSTEVEDPRTFAESLGMKMLRAFRRGPFYVAILSR